MITRDMTIEEIFKSYPHKSQRFSFIMTQAGLNCVGCQAATWETLEAGMLGHGFSDEGIEELLGRLNEVLEEKLDATSISFTKRAAEKFTAILAQEGKSGWGLRFADKPGGCGGFEYVLDYSEKASPDDEIFTSHGVEIHVNKNQVERLLGSEVDFQDGLQGTGFKVTNPNVTGSCSCGQSQSY